MAKFDREISENLRIMAQVISEICQRSTREMVSPVPLSRNQFTILRILANSGELPIGEIARVLDISNAATSKNIDRLEGFGFVMRQAVPGDRRSLGVVVLDKGAEIIAEYDRSTEEKQVMLLRHFSAEDKKLLLDYLRRIIKHTLAEEQNTDVICKQCSGRCGEDGVIHNSQGNCSLPGRKSGTDKRGGAFESGG